MQMTFLITSESLDALNITHLQGGENWSYWEQGKGKKKAVSFTLDSEILCHKFCQKSDHPSQLWNPAKHKIKEEHLNTMQNFFKFFATFVFQFQ